jgi:hypothetical protein
MPQKTKTSKQASSNRIVEQHDSLLKPNQTLKKPTVFYHIKPVGKVDKIIKEGLNAYEGKIFVVTHHDIKIAGQNIIERIARTQMFLEEYALFKIEEAGITGNITADIVGEFTAQYHRIIHQNFIAPEFITLVEKVKLKPIGELLREQLKNSGLDAKDIDALIKSEEEYIRHTAKSKLGRIK